MKIKEFVKISPSDLARLSNDDLLKINNAGANLSNRRLSGLIAAGGTVSPAFQGLPKSVRDTQKFNVDPNASRNRMIAMIQSQQIYLKSGYSTGTDWRKMSAKIEKEYGRTYAKYRYTIEGGIIPEAKAKKSDIPTFTRSQIKKFWNVFHKLQEARPEMFTSVYDKQAVFSKISAYFKEKRNVNENEALKALESEINADIKRAEEEKRAELEAIRSGKHKSF